MLFNSFEFIVFLVLVFMLYWFVFAKRLKIQNGLLLVSSYVFYGWWDYRFLGLILLSTVVDYLAGRALQHQKGSQVRKAILLSSVFFNISLLGFFKYYNFFITSWVALFASLGYNITSLSTLNIILPVGISFYTFQTMSYTIDVYRGQMRATKDFISFAAFVSFFPQLVAGPIERAANLLPQMRQKRVFQYSQGVDGMRLILWGLFKKVVIADSLAPEVDYIFSNYTDVGSGTLLLGAVYFSFQIYGDFSGYSDIAIGVSKLFGFELMSNFKFPYFSRNISEFWHRWHISLSTWFRDYLYFPLGGSRVSRPKAIRNIFIIFLVSGFWHGANWTFLVWGGIHALLYLPSFFFKTNVKYKGTMVAQGRRFPTAVETVRMCSTFSMVALAWIFFRSANVRDAWGYLRGIMTQWDGGLQMTSGLLYVVLLLAFEWRLRPNERSIIFSKRQAVRYTVYVVLGFMVYQKLFSADMQFIYFQF
jgi:D-alanyl-lipoteichoic acid acyltransferase DltB (MBOAT superfamily)